MSNTPIAQYIIDHPELFRYMDYLQEIFMLADRRLVTDLVSLPDHTYTTTYDGMIPNYPGELFVGPERKVYALISATRTDDRTSDTPSYTLILRPTEIVIPEKETTPLVTPQTQITISSSDIVSCKSTTPITTTIGRYLMNAFLLVPLFGDSVPYHNAELTQKQYEKYLGEQILAKQISPEIAKTKGIDNYFFLLSRPELFSPNITVKALTTDPEIPKVRAQLIAERKDRLEAGDPTAMSEVETPLIQMDKDRLKDDPSIHYYLGKDDFSNKRKKLLVVTGSIETFGKPGQFKFIDTPLADGWSYYGTPILINESRHGSQSRAIETAKGGEDAKYIGRVFASLYITEPDCKTTKGMEETLRPDNFEDNFNRYIIETDGSLILLDNNTAEKYMNKTVTFRSPFMCQAKKGFCAKCISHTFEALGQEALLTAVRNISAQFTTDSLKRSHISGVKTFKITNLNDFLM